MGRQLGANFDKHRDPAAIPGSGNVGGLIVLERENYVLLKAVRNLLPSYEENGYECRARTDDDEIAAQSVRAWSEI